MHWSRQSRSSFRNASSQRRNCTCTVRVLYSSTHTGAFGMQYKTRNRKLQSKEESEQKLQLANLSPTHIGGTYMTPSLVPTIRQPLPAVRRPAVGVGTSRRPGDGDGPVRRPGDGDGVERPRGEVHDGLNQPPPLPPPTSLGSGELNGQLS